MDYVLLFIAGKTGSDYEIKKMTATGFLFLVIALVCVFNDSRAAQNTAFVLGFAGAMLLVFGITAFLWKTMP